MGGRLLSMVQQAKKIMKWPQNHVHSRNHDTSSKNKNVVPRGHITVYVGELQRKRFVVPISYLNHPTFLELLQQYEQEFGFHHPLGGLSLPCKEDQFLNLTSQLR
ncbi:auxin-responsive protein SAUR21-like [Prosopis cineraria]|uniref:auxin-responsive protein SAUR21-like n=1 Tax=Prosopis cineraria TaxID=364024 RepID=UPI00240F5FFC|nr:auxin-responsive protein SAUR21-like [Prosopis cineraria]